MPAWLKKRLPAGGSPAGVARGLRQRGLHTICEQGRCPNRGECFARGVATLLVMGPACTRSCAFCAVQRGRPAPLDPEEPARVAAQVAVMGLRLVVITSVTRDDLPDGGALHLAAVTRAVQRRCPGVAVELLVPDFQGSSAALKTVLAAGPQVLAHNLETVPRLYPAVRPQADYGRSLELLRRAAQEGGALVKSGLMLGLGESRAEVDRALVDLRRAGCVILTLGQYLAPSPAHHPVVEYLHPQVFAALGRRALAMGFKAVAAAPLVRSSYLAEHYYCQGLGAGRGESEVDQP
ncbi:MAG: lipoyl synthase [Desulfarculus sp.]|nr:MAG: lipoyl synthase [Desulfarculus sp.]